MTENQELKQLLEKAEKYYYILQIYVLQLRALKSITLDYTDSIIYRMQDIDAKIQRLRDYLIDLNNKMLDIKYNGESITKEQSLQIDAFLFKCCSN